MKKLATIAFAALFIAGAAASAQSACCGGAKTNGCQKAKAAGGQQGAKKCGAKKSAQKCGANCQKPCCAKKGGAGKAAAKK